MKKVLSLILTLSALVSLGQSKKEQIITLNNRVDSLKLALSEVTQTKLSNEKRNALKIIKLNSKINESNLTLNQLNKENLDLKNTIKERNLLISQLEKVNVNLNNELEMNKLKLDSFKIEFFKQINITDSLQSLENSAENNWETIKSNLKLVSKDMSMTSEWLESTVTKFIKNPQSQKVIFTSECNLYVEDVIDNYWGYPGSIENDKLYEKWGSKYDLNYSNFSQPFSSGNGGWYQARTDINYLGSFNNGDWFKLIIKGSSRKDDYSEKEVRVVKVIMVGYEYKIDYIISL